MSDSTDNLIVALERPMKDEQLECIKNAIHCLRGVADVAEGKFVWDDGWQHKASLTQDLLPVVLSVLRLALGGLMPMGDLQVVEEWAKAKRDVIERRLSQHGR